MSEFLPDPLSSIGQLFDENLQSLQLSWIVPDHSSPEEAKAVWTGHGATPDLVGYFNLIHPARIQVLGHAEVAYIDRIDDRRRQLILAELTSCRPPAVLICDGLEASPLLVETCAKANIPLMATPRPAALAIEMLRHYLAKTLAQRTTLHGVLMDILGVGVLITGESGLGKSELALELISRGHGLVADDVVELARIGPSTIEGRCPQLLANLLEVRGLGLLDIKAIFGETAVRRKMRLRLIVHLVKRTTMEADYQRMPLDVLTENVLGLNVSKVAIPVDAGRNIAVLAEAAVRNTILQLRGIDTMQEFMARQAAEMRKNINDQTP